jgi:hypothetical protein
MPPKDLFNKSSYLIGQSAIRIDHRLPPHGIHESLRRGR